jgi:hypothetical protein
MTKSSRLAHWLLAALPLAALACQSSTEANNTNRNEMTAAQAKASVNDVSIGHQLGADGSIAADQKGNKFSPGQTVYISVQAGKAPAGTTVGAEWFGPDGQPLGNEVKTLKKGDSALTFASKDTSGWGKGNYHADVAVANQKVDSQKFSVSPENADSSASGPSTSPEDAINTVTVGHQLAADGSIAGYQKNPKFKPGLPVFVAFNVGGAPAGTIVHIDWMGPNGEKLLSDDKQVSPGQTNMSFTVRDTRAWEGGDYRADLTVAGQKVDSEHFKVAGGNGAGQHGK